MPMIKSIRALPYNVPLKSALTWGSGHVLPNLQHVLVSVELSDGAVGIAEATPRPSIYGETQVSVMHIVERHLAPRLLGNEVTDFTSVATLAARLSHIKNNNTAKGALDMALHQALCLSRGANLATYLGATRERILLSYIVSTGSAEAVAADVDSAFQAGIRVFKIKIGNDLVAEVAAIQSLIATYRSAQFYVDANETLEAASAAPLLRRLHDLGVMYCEEALPIHQLPERNQLRQDCPMPIIADDSAFTFSDLERELAFDSFDILNIKTARTGFSESRRMLALSAAKGKILMVGSQASSLLGCLQAAVFAGSEAVKCASECSFYLKTEADLRLAPEIVDGALELDAVGEALESLQASLPVFV